MKATSSAGRPLSMVLEQLERLAPLELAESWDSVGLLVAPEKPRRIRRALLTIDLTEAVLREALQLRAELVVAYHPPIFKGLSRIVGATAIERVVRGAVCHRLAVYSPHTALDAVEGGVNDWLCDAFGAAERSVLVPASAARNALEGAGRGLQLKRPISLPTAFRAVKRHLGLSALRVALPEAPTSAVRTVALCAGAGGGVLGGRSADLYLTGEMRHHDVLAATGRGTAVVLTEHSNSERGYLAQLAKRLTERAGVEALVAKQDRDPLQLV